MSKLKQPINFSDLIGKGAEFEIEPTEDIQVDSDDEQDNKKYEEIIANFTNLECIGEFQDEDVYKEGEPFTKIAQKMTNLIPNGEIKKRILRQGYGTTPEDGSVVKVHYNAYIEYNADPFDSTYARSRPHEFKINDGRVIPGLDIATQSMKLNEKSQFLISPTFAYGKLGCLNRVPENSTVLFEIELLQKIEAAAVDNYEFLPEDRQKEFAEVYKYCSALCLKGKEHFKRNIRDAIKTYNMAVSKLEFVSMSDSQEEQQQQELLLKLYTNLLVCYTKNEEPKKGCLNFNKMVDLSKGSNLKVNAKAYYNNAKCLILLTEYDLAKRRLMIAHRMEPKNPEILDLMKVLDDKKKEYEAAEKNIAKAIFGGSSTSSRNS